MGSTSLLRCLTLPWLVQVRRGSLVFDPFVGTGSILVAAAALGARTLGADIDVRVLRDGKTDASPARSACLHAWPCVSGGHVGPLACWCL